MDVQRRNFSSSGKATLSVRVRAWKKKAELAVSPAMDKSQLPTHIELLKVAGKA